MKLKKIVKKESLFIKTFNILKSNPDKLGLMVLFDALFLISAFGLQTLFRYFSQSFALPITLSAGIIFLVFSLVYYLIVLFVYSFFKYCVLDFIKSLLEKTSFSFNRLGQFYALNIIIAGIFLAVMLALNFILANIKQAYQPFVFIVLAAPYVLYLYAITNISHSLFYQGASIKHSIKNGFKITFTKIRSYRETILIMILAALVLWLLFLGSGYLVRLIGSKNYSLYLVIYAYFKNAAIIIFDIVFYFIILVNRTSFYNIAGDNK